MSNTDRALHLLLDYLEFCRHEQRIYDNTIRRHNMLGERLYNILDRYLSILQTNLSNTSTPNRIEMPNIFSNLSSFSRRRVRLNPIIRRTTLPSGLSDTIISRSTETHFYSDISTNEIMCPITQDLFISGDIILKIIGCGHIFKTNALRRWFLNNSLCPVCRYDLSSRSPSETSGLPTRIRTRAYDLSANIS